MEGAEEGKLTWGRSLERWRMERIEGMTEEDKSTEETALGNRWNGWRRRRSILAAGSQIETPR